MSHKAYVIVESSNGFLRQKAIFQQQPQIQITI